MKVITASLTLLFCLGATAQSKSLRPETDSLIKTVSNKTGTDSITSQSDKIYINIKGEEKGWWSDWLPFVATIIVAYAAYRGVIKQSKASSISGFRVKWIEDLRVSYSQFLIALRNVDNKIRHGKLDIKKNTKDEDLVELQFLKTKIKLLINHSENEHIEFWEALTKYMQQHNEYYRGPYLESKEQELDNMRVEMEKLLLVIFKKEWEKAKNFW